MCLEPQHDPGIDLPPVTERARKLRAQYALQAQSLRTRIELRINRIPTSLRQANMGELLGKYQEMSDQKQQSAPREDKAVGVRPMSVHKPRLVSEESDATDIPKLRGTKRTRRVYVRLSHVFDSNEPQRRNGLGRQREQRPDHGSDTQSQEASQDDCYCKVASRYEPVHRSLPEVSQLTHPSPIANPLRAQVATKGIFYTSNVTSEAHLTYQISIACQICRSSSDSQPSQYGE